MAKACRLWTLGPGFEPQVPPKLFVIFLHIIVCKAQKKLYHVPLVHKAPCGLKRGSCGQRCRTPYTLVKAHAANFQKSMDRALSGLENGQYTFKSGPNPPLGLHLIFFFYMLVCRFQKKVHHAPCSSSMPRVFNNNPVARRWSSPCTQSTNRHLIQEVNTGLA